MNDYFFMKKKQNILRSFIVGSNLSLDNPAWISSFSHEGVNNVKSLLSCRRNLVNVIQEEGYT